MFKPLLKGKVLKSKFFEDETEIPKSLDPELASGPGSG
jgi:hypothetical protein